MAEDRLVEIMAELLAEVHEMRIDINSRLGEIQAQLQSHEKLLQSHEKLLQSHEELLQSHEELLTKIPLELGEMRLSYMQLTEKIAELLDFNSRINRLEEAVFRKAS